MIGESAALTSALLWALSNVLMGSQSGRVPALVISALRCLAAAVVLVLIVAAMTLAGEASYPSSRQMLEIAASGIVTIGIGDTLYIGSLGRVGVSRAFPISMALYPLLTIVLAVALLGEAVTAATVGGTLMIIAGVYLIVVSGSAPPVAGARRTRGDMAIGLGLVVLASILWAGGSVWLRSAADGVSPLVTNAIRLPAAGVVAAVIAAGVGCRLDPRQYSARGMWALALTGVLGTGLGSLLFVVGVQEIGAARTAVLSSCAPLFALPLAALILGERITPRLAAGTALTIAGIWLVV